MFYRQASLAKTILVMCLPIPLLAVPVLLPHFDIRDYFREQPVRDIVGKWRVVYSGQSAMETAFYEFRADGTYTERVRFETLTGPEPGTSIPSGTALVDETYNGRYKLSRNNRITLIDQSNSDSIHLKVQGQGLVNDWGQRWYRASK